MSNNVENMMIEHLRALRAGQDRIENELKEVKHRLTGVESGIAGIRRDNAGMQEDVYGQQAAFDKLKERVELIEKMLSLRTA